ncbi:5643_t:CDS:2, partial [Acaulospora morrowiae]
IQQLKDSDEKYKQIDEYSQKKAKKWLKGFVDSLSEDRLWERFIEYGRQPDIMFVLKYLEVFFELLYVECSRLYCTQQKKKNDEIKLWRETNDGMYYVRKVLKPDKDQFGVVGVQICYI